MPKSIVSIRQSIADSGFLRHSNQYVSKQHQLMVDRLLQVVHDLRELITKSLPHHGLADLPEVRVLSGSFWLQLFINDVKVWSSSDNKDDEAIEDRLSVERCIKVWRMHHEDQLDDAKTVEAYRSNVCSSRI